MSNIKLPTKPHIPYNTWKVEYDEPMKSFDPSKLSLHLESEQEDKKYVSGTEMQKRMKGKGLNSNVLEHLLKHPELIPESWKKDAEGNTRYIFFWGTVYRYSDGYLFVRYLCWFDGAWGWSLDWLGGDWGFQYPAAVSEVCSQILESQLSLEPVSLDLAIEIVKKEGYMIFKSI